MMICDKSVRVGADRRAVTLVSLGVDVTVIDDVKIPPFVDEKERIFDARQQLRVPRIAK